ncbi:DeoR/GlpR family DNA-binding transcription regulator [Brevibacillus sp. NRS-1366]|uniref:DeoR/GlpR family DNA-binding transcription regulator n=1 Tax=Brevibacillus sp. NRS-1366 TaxID=3233899 RepID=UPI003D2050C3
MFSDERRDKILDLLQKDGRVLARDLADLFDMSIDSIRRDLTIMEEKGLLKRTHGGAIPVSKVRTSPLPPALRYQVSSPHQQAIAKIAASFIQEKDTVFIGSAGIHYCMLPFLPDLPITVVTNSIKVADALKDRETIDVYLVGGKVKNSGSITDALANEFLRQFTLDICFVTGGGISKNGVSTSTPEVASLGRVVAEISRRTICLAPHEKLGTDFFVKEVPITDIDLLITDDEASMEAIEEIESNGVQVVIAKTEENE